ncbi:MAG: FAD-dependent oxidoreductase, partial [Spirochaetaceae bacterium]|nr:FAD-dependent oxidoreductase [Spirochaetaceae bacterium]
SRLLERAAKLSDAQGGGSVTGEAVLMSVGRRPVTDGMGLEDIGLDIRRGAVVVDEKMRTNLPGIWAAGDCTGKSLLAHSAYRMGEVAVADMLSGGQGRDRMRYDAIPSVVYSLPEAAGVGLREADAEKAGRKVIVKKLPMQYSGRYLAEYGQDPGFGKVVIDAETRALLGVHLAGGQCSEIIWGAGALIEAEFRVDDVRELIFPHPTVSEIVREVIWEF